MCLDILGRKRLKQLVILHHRLVNYAMLSNNPSHTPQEVSNLASPKSNRAQQQINKVPSACVTLVLAPQ